MGNYLRGGAQSKPLSNTQIDHTKIQDYCKSLFGAIFNGQTSMKAEKVVYQIYSFPNSNIVSLPINYLLTLLDLLTR